MIKWSVPIFILLVIKTTSTWAGGFDADSIKRKKIVYPNDSLGKYVMVNRLFVTGNRVTRDQIILRELTLKSGDVIYSLDLPDILKQDERKIFNTRLFNTVEVRTLELEPNKVDILVEVHERWYTFPVPIFSLSDRNFNEWWETYNHDFRRTNYGLRLYQYNMRGRNETLRLTAQFGFQRLFELSYRMPYIDKKQKHGLVFDFAYFENKNLAYQTLDHKLEFKKSSDLLRTVRKVGLSYTFRNSFYQNHLLQIAHSEAQISDSVKLLNENYLRENTIQSFTSVSYHFNYDRRDIAFYPLRGHYLSIMAQQSGLSSSEDLNKTEVNLLFTKYSDLKNNWFLSNYSLLYMSTEDQIPYYNFSALGYYKRFVRGYEIYVIEGPQYFLNKTTLKKRVFSQRWTWNRAPLDQFRHMPLEIYLKAYADFGYVKNYEGYTLSNRLSNKLISGAGTGIDIVGSYDVVIRLEYTFNAEGDNGLFIHLKKEF
ncbi:MAG: BamA/TamA family outer membrane protein [Flammeovirgaceae bacterium]|nr:BamA/TamA family outer membrane protein [Flammeovirgaceae bacterium]